MVCGVEAASIFAYYRVGNQTVRYDLCGVCAASFEEVFRAQQQLVNAQQQVVNAQNALTVARNANANSRAVLQQHAGIAVQQLPPDARVINW